MIEHKVPFGRTGLKVSTVGFGSYRVHDQVAEHREALRAALAGGVNLIDTSTNYGDGGSERLVGEVLAENFSSGKLRRDDVVVVSKVGYVQGANLDLVKAREAAGKPYAEVVKYGDECWHCIHPEFIEDQIELSIERLRLEKIDVYLLHNPEYFFMDAIKRKNTGNVEKLQHDFYDRVRRAFVCLEDLCEKGVIGCYGVSSNTFVTPTRNLDSTNIDVMLDIARQIGQEKYGNGEAHHFSVVQLPANLVESGAFAEKNNKDTTPAEYCRANNLALLINRPLNAITPNGMIRLAEVFAPGEKVAPWKDEIQKTKKNLTNVQDWFAKNAAAIAIDMRFLTATVEELADIDVAEVDLEGWRMWAGNRLMRGFSNWARDMSQKMDQPQQLGFAKVWESLWTGLQDLVRSGDGLIRQRMGKASAAVRARYPELQQGPVRNVPLQRCAISALANTPGVSSVLVGMRSKKYVDDSLAAARLNVKVTWR